MSGLKLQATLAAANPSAELVLGPHHPITCTGERLTFDEHNRLACEHGQVPPDDRRTRSCVDHSIAILIFELLQEREDGDVPRRS